MSKSRRNHAEIHTNKHNKNDDRTFHYNPPNGMTVMAVIGAGLCLTMGIAKTGGSRLHLDGCLFRVCAHSKPHCAACGGMLVQQT